MSGITFLLHFYRSPEEMLLANMWRRFNVLFGNILAVRKELDENSHMKLKLFAKEKEQVKILVSHYKTK